MKTIFLTAIATALITLTSTCAHAGNSSIELLTRGHALLNEMFDRLDVGYRSVENAPAQEVYSKQALQRAIEENKKAALELVKLTETDATSNNAMAVFRTFLRQFHHNHVDLTEFWGHFRPTNQAALKYFRANREMIRIFREWVRLGMPALDQVNELQAEVTRLQNEAQELRGKQGKFVIDAAEVLRKHYSRGEYRVADRIANLEAVTDRQGRYQDPLAKFINAQLNGYLSGLLNQTVLSATSMDQAAGMDRSPLSISVMARITGFKILPRPWFLFWKPRQYQVDLQLEGRVGVPWMTEGQTSPPVSITVVAGQPVELSRDARMLIEGFYNEVLAEAKRAYSQVAGHGIEQFLASLASQGMSIDQFTQAVTSRPVRVLEQAEAAAAQSAQCASKLGDESVDVASLDLDALANVDEILKSNRGK